MDLELTLAEKRAIRKLQEVATTWPATLWLYSAGGTLTVMRCGADGKPAMRIDGKGDDAVDQDYTVCTIEGIPNDGGDW